MSEHRICRVLVVLDGSRASWAGFVQGNEVAMREHATLTVVGVLREPSRLIYLGHQAVPFPLDELRADAERELECRLAAARQEVGAGVSVTTRVLRGPSRRALRTLAADEGFDLVIDERRSRSARRRRITTSKVYTGDSIPFG